MLLRAERDMNVVDHCVLEGDADAAARGVFDGPFGLAVEAVVLQAAKGRSQGGEVGYGSTRPTGGRGRGRRGARSRAVIVWMGMRKGCRKSREEDSERLRGVL